MLEKYIDRPNGRVYYWTNEAAYEKEGFAIVLLHGLTADHTLFRKQVKRLKNSYKLVNLDLPLHGKSRPYQNFTFQHVNEALVAILAQEEVDKILLIGQSAGGYIAQAFMAAYPERVLGFMGIGTTPFGKTYYKKSELFWVKHFATIARLYPYSLYCRAAVKAIARQDDARENMARTLQHLGKEGMLEAARAVYGAFLKETAEVPFVCPVILTYGEFDQTGYVKKYNQAWSKRAGYPLQVIPQAAHNANDDNEEAFHLLIFSFIEEIQSFSSNSRSR